MLNYLAEFVSRTWTLHLKLLHLIQTEFPGWTSTELNWKAGAVIVVVGCFLAIKTANSGAHPFVNGVVLLVYGVASGVAYSLVVAFFN